MIVKLADLSGILLFLSILCNSVNAPTHFSFSASLSANIKMWKLLPNAEGHKRDVVTWKNNIHIGRNDQSSAHPLSLSLHIQKHFHNLTKNYEELLQRI